MHDAEQLAALVERSRMDVLAQQIIDGGIDGVVIPGESRRNLPEMALTLEDALLDLLSAGIQGHGLAGMHLFAGRVRRLLEAEIERYAADNAAELSAVLDERAAELTGGE